VRWQAVSVDTDEVLLDHDVSGWLLYQMPDGRQVRVDAGHRAELPGVVVGADDGAFPYYPASW